MSDAESQVASVIESADQPLTTNQVADRAGVDWHTAAKYLKQLTRTGRVQQLDMGWAIVWSVKEK